MLRLSRRQFLQTSAAVGLGSPALLGAAAAQPPAGETLYNGIKLGVPWPPDNRYLSPDPIDPPYLADPPAVVSIDVGRQLFVDDFLIEESSLARVFHRATYHPRSPILAPQTAWELRDEYADRTRTKPNPTAMVFSDGVFFDPADRVFKMWYMGGYNMNTCLAVSADGLEWQRPSFGVVKGTNIVTTSARDSNTVWLDPDDRDGIGRYKMAFYSGSDGAMLLRASADGIHWRDLGRTGPTGDRSTFFWNPFRQRWVFSVRDHVDGKQRHRRYFECRNFGGARWTGTLPAWIGADSQDLWRPEFNTPPELYNLDCVAYESLLLGLFTVWHGEREDREKPNDITVGYSRDGFHWSRPSREAFIGVSEREGDWNWANVQSAGGCCLVVGDVLYFYVSGRQGEPGTNRPGVCSTGLATLRRDGFASVGDDAQSPQPVLSRSSPPRSLTTRPVRFTGSHLFVNADVNGELRVEVLDRSGRVIEPYSAERAIPVTGNGTRLPVMWRGRSTLDELAGEPVRFRFRLTRGRLFAFWVSLSREGHSRGFVGAGGPEFRRTSDTA